MGFIFSLFNEKGAEKAKLGKRKRMRRAIKRETSEEREEELIHETSVDHFVQEKLEVS